jgi:hypothetical protein
VPFTGFPNATSGTYNQSFDLSVVGTYNAAFIAAHGGTVASAKAAFIAALKTGQTYANIHDSTFPGGEIRGQLAPANAHDYDGDGRSDIIWQDTSGNTAVWLMNGAVIMSAGAFQIPGWSIVGQRDFNADGNSDLLWRDGSGNTYVWLMNGTTATSALYIGNISGWSVAAVGSFAGVGTGLVWKDAASDFVLWLMNPSQPNTVSSTAFLGTLPGWQIAGTGDFNGDGFTDLLWRDAGVDAQRVDRPPRRSLAVRPGASSAARPEGVQRIRMVRSAFSLQIWLFVRRRYYRVSL